MRAGDHCGYGHTVTCKIAKGFEPAGTERTEVLLLKDSGIESIGVVDEILEMFESQKGGKGGASQGFEKFVKSVGPETNNNIIFRGDIPEGGRDAGCQRNFEEIVHHFGQSNNKN